MRKRFCPKCGVTIETGTLCPDCSFTEIEYEVPLVQISEFSRTFHKGSWHHFRNLDDVLVKRIREVIGSDVDVDIEPFEFEPKPKSKTTVYATVYLETGKIQLPIKLSYMQCEYGQKEKTEYFEGILQIQNSHDAVIDYVDQEMKKIAHKGVFITKTAPTKTGVDLFMTNKTQMRILGQKLVNHFGGELSLNAQLFSHNHETSKDIYRLNVLVKLAPFKVGEVIAFDRSSSRGKILKKQFIKVTSLGKLIHGLDLETGKQEAFEIKYATEIKTIPIRETTVVATIPELLVLDPDTYQEVVPRNIDVLNTTFEIQNKVSIVNTEKGTFIIN
jgi:NMD protein affecting ribosome stability and mRNA decay